jgi:glycosyltransferase involved in cell wall biosynthesis
MRIVLDLQGAQSDSRFRGIGRYSLALAQAIARQAKQHHIWLALNGRYPESADALRLEFVNLIPEEQIRVFELPGPVAELNPINTWRMQAAELLREKFLADLRPDIVHISTLFEGLHNEVVASVDRLESNLPTVVTLYDLIPMVYPEGFLADPEKKRCYLRRVQSLKKADLLLAISESSRREAIEMLQISSGRITTIGSGVSEWFSPQDVSEDSRQALMQRCGLRKPFILCAGTVDPNKNLQTLIAAFGLLPDELRRTYQLAISGKITEEERRPLLSRVPKSVAAGDVVFVGYVSDEDLRLLYGTCSLFVLPSLHEGFGLPLVEAMACGAAVIGSNSTSIPEIIDRPEALFNPLSPQAIADCMGMVLSKPELRRSLQEWGLERSKIFSWESCGRKALAAFETVNAERRRERVRSSFSSPTKGSRPNLAFVSPLPPTETRLADYAANALPILSLYYDIVCIVDQCEVADNWITRELRIRNLDWFKANANAFERIVYQLGNSVWHKHIFNLFAEHPGVVELHDLYLGETLDWMDRSGYAPGIFGRFLYDSHGFFALKKDREDGRIASIHKFSCNAPVFRASAGVIVHSNETPHLTAAVPGFAPKDLYRHFAEISDCGEPLMTEKSAEHYVRAIEHFYEQGAHAFESRLLAAIAQTSARTRPSDRDIAQTAIAISVNRPRLGGRQMLVDVTNIAESDACNRMESATRRLLMSLIDDPPPSFRVEPIRAESGRYVYARRFMCRFLGFSDENFLDDPVETCTADIFLGIAWEADQVRLMKPWFMNARLRGVHFFFVVHDMLPVLRPELFRPEIVSAALAGIREVTEIADGIACISRTVADELFNWLEKAKPARRRPLSLGFFHLGADLNSTASTKTLTEEASKIFSQLKARPSFLVVGTVEPRRCHRQVFAAMDRLWQQGVDANLLVVGELGWSMDDLAIRLQQHPEQGLRLFWLRNVSSEMLNLLYTESKALIAASDGEGFGLHLIEAAQHGLPIIARDIPVFREVAGDHAYYFSGVSADALASALQSWLSAGDAVPKSTGITRLTWHQSSRQLIDIIRGARPYEQ